MYILHVFGGLVAVEGAEGPAEEVTDSGVGPVVGAFGGGVVAGDEAEGSGAVAVVEGVGPIEVAGAEGGEIERPLGVEDDSHADGAEFGIGIRPGIVAAEGEGVGLPHLGHGVEGRVVATAMGSGGAGFGGSEGRLHGFT
jgi:hypothetical protein